MRLFPGLMLAAAIGAGMKAASVAEGLMSPGTAYAAGSPAADAAPAEAPKPDTKAAAKPADAPAHTEKPADKPAQAAPAAPQAQPEVSSRGEADVLERLSQRRQELEARERELTLRENMIQAAEKRVAERIAELKTIEGQVKTLLAERDKQEQEQLISLVRMYEAMKPAEAARIFEKLEKSVLVPVAAAMKPAKVAGVLAAMEPVKAQELTVLLATRHNAQTGQGAAKTDPAPLSPAPASAAPAVPALPAPPQSPDLKDGLKPATGAAGDAPLKAEPVALKADAPEGKTNSEETAPAPAPLEPAKLQPTPVSHEAAPSAH